MSLGRRRVTAAVRPPKKARMEHALDLLVAAAECVVPNPEALKPRSFATWVSTRQDDDFDADSSIPYLRREGTDVDESLLRRYGRLHRMPNSVDLRGITSIAPWIECLDVPFVEYASFAKIRENPRFVEILTFTTPAVTESGDAAFLEVWTEDGRYPQMGLWWWIQMGRTDGRWTPVWKHMHAIS
jgi:hypothetical protein